MDDLRKLKDFVKCIEICNLIGATTIIDSIESCLKQQISSAEICYALQKLFQDPDGSLAFLKKISENMSRYCKIFEKCVIRLMTLHTELIRNYPSEVRKNKYEDEILPVTFVFMSHSSSSAKVKELSIGILLALIETEAIPLTKISEVVNRLLSSYDSRRTKVYYGREILKTLGAVTKLYSNAVTETYQKLILNVLIETIEVRLLEQHYLNYTLLSGAFQGLNDYLLHFSFNLDANFKGKLYDNIKMISLNTPGEGKDASRKALNIFTYHHHLFNEQIFSHSIFWQDTLRGWVNSENYDDKRIGLQAIHAFHSSLAQSFQTRNSEKDDKILLKKIVTNFRHTLQSSNATFHDTRIAIRGFGTLSKACCTLLEEQFLNEVMTLVLQRIKFIDYKEDSSKSKKQLEHFPDYIHSMSEILTSMNGLTAVQLSYLEQIIVQLMRDFYYLSSTHHNLVIISLLHTLENLQKLGVGVLSDFIDKIVFQGVVWSCDKCLTYDAEWSEGQDWKENVTYKFYLPLWKGLVKNQSVISQKILTVLLRTLFQIISKLNFNTRKRIYKDDEGHDQEFNFCDPNIDLVPVKPQDFHIFVNLVDFYTELLTELSFNMKQSCMSPWIGHAIKEFIQKNAEYPLVSGFIKLLEIFIKIGKEIGFFKELDNPKSLDLKSNLDNFLKNVFQRVDQATGELELAYLKLIFVNPVTLLVKYVRQIASIYEIAFDFGKSLPLLWIASMALSSLDNLVEEISSQSDRKFLLRHVMPSLETFMSSSVDVTQARIKTEIIKPKRGRTDVRRQYEIVDGTETELLKFQKRIVVFLGKLSLEECQFLLGQKLEKLELVKWSPNNYLDIKIQANVFQLDPLIPRITYLALNSSERKSKVAACEFLHTIILYLIGTNQLSCVIWVKLSSKIIHLGCDSDATVQEMFEPLLYQIVHHLSMRDYIHLEGTQSFIDSLLEQMSHPRNNTIQDLSAKLLREFVSWSLRHVPRERQDSMPSNLRTLFDRLKLFSTDANINKRKAAILTFNNLYRITRNEERLVSEMWLDTFYCFCNSYMMTENFYINNHQKPELDQNNMAMDNFMKVFVVKRQIFDQNDPNRRVPAPFGEEIGLKSLALWLLDQCGMISQRNYRLKCIEMFSIIAKCVGSSPNNTIHEFISNENIKISEIFLEAHGQGLKFQETQFNKSWFEVFLAALDGFHWIIEKKLFDSIENVFQPVFVNAIQDFLNSMTSVSVSEMNSTLSTYENEYIKKLKQIIIIKIVEIFKSTLKIQSKSEIFERFLTENLQIITKILNLMIFEPFKVDFPLHENSETNFARRSAVNFFTEVSRCDTISVELKEALLNGLSEIQISTLNYLINSFKNNIHFDTFESDHYFKAKGLYITLTTHPISTELTKNLFEELLTLIFNSIKISTVITLNETSREIFYASNPPPKTREFVSILLKIVLLSDQILPQIMECIFNTTELKVQGNEIKYGDHFLITYKSVLMEFIGNHVESVLKTMFDDIPNEKFVQNLKFICDLCEFTRKLSTDEGKIVKGNLINMILSLLEKIFEMAKACPDNELHVINMITHLMMIFTEEPMYKLDRDGKIQKWFIEMMAKDEILWDVKTKSLIILPCFTGSQSRVESQSDLMSALVDHLLSVYFPQKCSDFPEGSIKRESLIACFQGILDALVATRSPVILMFLIKASAAEPDHPIEHEIRKGIEKYTTSQESETLKSDLEMLFKVFCERHRYFPIRMTVLKRYFLVMLKASPENVVKSFFNKENYTKIMKLIKNGQGQIHDLVDKIGGFQLLEIFFGISTKEYLESPESPLYDPSKSQKASLEAIFACRDELKKINIYTDLDHSEYFRKSQCAAFNCLCTILANHQTNPMVYNKFLFENQQIWKNLIKSGSDVYQMSSQEIEDYPVVRKRIVAIRDISKVVGIKENRHFHMTTSIYASSLSQDVLKMDFSNTMVRSAAEVAQRENVKSKFGEIALEKIMINDHECMANICAIIHHMYEKKISNFNFTVPWIENLCKMMESHPEINVRRFIAKVIDNCRDIFKLNVARVYRALMKFLVDEGENSPINPFITDLCVLLLEWSENYKLTSDDEKTMASKLIGYLVRNSKSDRRDILKVNLEILKNLIEIWKEFVQIPYETLLETISRTFDKESKENLYGIHLNAVILATGRVTWTTENKNDYFKAIEMSLNNKSAAIYQPAAQLYGMCLKEEFKKKSESDFLEDPRIIELIRRLKEDLNLDRNNAPDILYGIQKYCDYILEPFSNLILSKIPVSIRNIKLKYLEMFLSGMKYYDKSFLYKEIMSTIDLKQLLRNPDFKVISLHIVNRALPLVSPKEVESLYSEVATLIDDSSSEIRDIVYEILMFIYKELAGQIDLNILTATGSFLVEGILDTDVEIQKILIKFWSDPNQLPSALDKRLEKLLCDIYKANSSNFLTAATLLLLYPAITDPNSALPLFQYTPGPDVKHVERFIDTSWRRSMTFTKPPLFVETKALKKTLHTISTQIEGIQMSQNSSQENPEGVPFTPTIDPSLFFNVRDDFSKSIVTQDSFVVPTQVKTLTRRSNLLETQMIANSQSNYGHLRQRFTKQSQNIQRDKAIRAISYRNQRQQESKNAAKERQLSVTLYRRYRDGDFPDLNINALAILLPLQALLKFDKNIARQVLNELFKITSKIGLAREMPIHQSTIANGISRILLKIENSVDMTFVATLFDFAIVNSSVFTMLPETVKNISKASNNITLGILYLEERLNLIDGESDETSLISSVSGNMSVEEHWMQLTDLYRCLSEHDMLNSIFANQIQVDGRLPKAISMMAENRFDLADELWTEILEAINEDKYEYDFSFQSRYDCLASLSDWDALEQNVAPYLAQNEKIWEPGFNQDVILPNLMTAETRLILSEIYDPNTEFLEHLLQWTINPPYWNHLRQHFSEELIMLMVAQTDFNQARLISDQRIRGILLEWSDLNVLSDKLQFNKLEKIRIISELFSTIETFFLASKIDQRTFEKTIKFYNHTLPSIRDSTIFWDTIIMYRTFFWRKLIDLTMDEELAEFEESLFETINKQQVNLFNVALKQENLGLAKNVLKRIEITSKDDTQKSLLRCQLEIKYTKDHGNVIEKLDALQKTVKNSLNIVKELTEASHSNLKINSNLNLAEIGEILLFTPESYHNHATYRQYTRLQTPTAFNVQRKVISYLQNAVDQSEISNDVHNLADCCMKYADFAFTCLEILNLDDKLTLQEDIIKYTLRSMRLGHYRARELFVRILQLPNLHNEQKISDTFKNEVSQVPDWLFLNWIEQILCHIKLDSECCLDVIVENLAKSYPSALLYPLRFILNNLEEGVNLRPFLKGILNSLETPLMNRFIDEMTLVCLPAVKVKNSIEKLIKILNSNEGEFATAISMEVEMWLKNCESHGEDYQKYAKYMKNFENLKKYDMKRAKEKIFTALRHMQIEISKVVQRSRNSLSIERLSPWLANYQLTSGTDSISILGQFVHLKSKPHPDEHAKIVKIDPNLIVLTSLRRPIKIKFHGSDGREYAFLTKYGEDLRQDQRIQQLLSIMSDKMKNNVNCRAQNLQLITYNVTPINSLFGLLNWVGDTISLMLAVRESYKRTENNDYDKFEENVVSKEHKKFITDTHPYHIIAQEATRQEIVEKHQKLVSLIPNGLLKQSLVTYASSLENYYVLKRNFIQSIAAISISHWILGIGDRHLDNTLIDTKTFKLIGIDFGHAFGTATRQLQVPELIPFRMTKQLQSVMEPHGVTGLFERCMTHAMRCFRNEQAVLRACMDLFVREPTIGWLDRSLVTPEIIIDMACSKLQGANSAKITVQELELNRFINKTGYQRILKSANYYGDEVKDLTVEDQVKKLIAQATDEALLGITYYGWRPFL